MSLLNISVNGNSARRASVFFKNGGVVLTDLFGGQGNSWIQITDPEFLKRITDARAKGESFLLASPVWQELAKQDPTKVGQPYTAAGSKTNAATAKSGRKVGVHADPTETTPKVDLKNLVTKWFNFFSEFHFRPQPRFMNSLALLGSLKEMRSYVVGYFELTNNSYAQDVEQKVKSREFDDLAADTALVRPTHRINTRLEIYYGEPGGGKTTTAICNNPDAKVVLCHASMTPDELFRGFDFEEEKDADGKVTGSHPVFKGCALREAMEQGKTVILDEINLLNEDCRRALQAVTDAKAAVTINNDTIAIKEGFKVVGTMNLNVGDMVFPLPEPLVDRAQVIKRFEMDPAMVAQLAF